MLSHDGLFLTAGHCVNVAFGERDITGRNAHDPSDYAIMAVEFSQRAFKFCQVLDLSICPTCDVAVGRAELPGSDYPDVLGLATARLGEGSAVLGIGYPDSHVEGEPGGPLMVSMFARCYAGKIEEWRSGLVPWNGPRSAGYRHSVTTPPGFSGGPPDPQANRPRSWAHGWRLQQLRRAERRARRGRLRERLGGADAGRPDPTRVRAQEPGPVPGSVAKRRETLLRAGWSVAGSREPRMLRRTRAKSAA